jgi:hypothetical protein
MKRDKSSKHGKRAKVSDNQQRGDLTPEEAAKAATSASAAVVTSIESSSALKALTVTSSILTFINENGRTQYDSWYELTLHDTMWYLTCDIIQVMKRQPRTTDDQLSDVRIDTFTALFSEYVFILQQCFFGMQRAANFDADLETSIQPWLRMQVRVPRRVVPYLQLNSVPTTTGLDSRPMIFNNASWFFRVLMGSIAYLQCFWLQSQKLQWNDFVKLLYKTTQQIMLLWRSKRAEVGDKFSLSQNGLATVCLPTLTPVSYSASTTLDPQIAQMMSRLPQACAIRVATRQWATQVGFEKFSKTVQDSIFSVPIFITFERRLLSQVNVTYDVADLLSNALDMAVQPVQSADNQDQSEVSMDEVQETVPLEQFHTKIVENLPPKQRSRRGQKLDFPRFKKSATSQENAKDKTSQAPVGGSQPSTAGSGSAQDSEAPSRGTT